MLGRSTVTLFGWLLPVAATASEQAVTASSLVTRAQRERFLLKADVVGHTALQFNPEHSWRADLDDGKQRHAASVETSTSADPSQRDYRCNVAAYELDKLLGLDLVAPSVERTLNGQPASVTWWVDDVLTDELHRRAERLEPPEAGAWNEQMQAVRVFDELIANTYRDIDPAAYTSTVWDNLLITKDWRIWLIDHTRAFATPRTLKHPESLARCDRTLLSRLRELSREASTRSLGRLLTSEQLDALEARRAQVVRHFDERIATLGRGAVLYDLRRQR